MPCPYIDFTFSHYSGVTYMAMSETIRSRRSIRLPGYDYARPGAYFVTICVHQRECILGAVANGNMISNELGKIVQACWEEIPSHFYHAELDSFVVMPNHLHGIIVLGRGTACCAPTKKPVAVPTTESFAQPVPGSLPTIVRSFKSATTRQINAIRDTPNMPVWQRNYYEHVIRSEEALNRAREYIAANPLRWHLDRENPQHQNNE